MNPQDNTAQSTQSGKLEQVRDLLTARVILQEIRGDLYQYICSPARRESIQSRMYEKFSLIQTRTSSCIQASPDLGGDTDEDLCRLLTRYEDLMHDAFHDIDTGKEQDVIISLDNGLLNQNHLKIDEYLTATTVFPDQEVRQVKVICCRHRWRPSLPSSRLSERLPSCTREFLYPSVFQRPLQSPLPCFIRCRRYTLVCR